MVDQAGNLFGTTQFGGIALDCCGVVFELAPDGTEPVLHAFCAGSCSDNAAPYGGLIADGTGNLFGTTITGGAGSGARGIYRIGVKFKTLYTFPSRQSGCPRGSHPLRQLLLDASGDLFGVTSIGPGGTQGGMVYELTP